MTEEQLKLLQSLAKQAATVADTIKDIEAVDGETWVIADGISNDLAKLEHELWVTA